MSDEERDTQQRADDAETKPSILAALPHTRPQRSSPRRASSAQNDKPGAEPTTEQASATKRTEAGKRAAQAKRTRAAETKERSAKKAQSSPKPPPTYRREPPAPKQGYEPQEETRTGTTVHPPSGAELVESIATIFGELASAGLKAGGRALKDALGPLRRP